MDELINVPYNIEAEQALLGGIILDNSKFDDIADKVSDDDFFRVEHQLIFKAIKYLHSKDQPFDMVTLFEFIESRGKKEVVTLSYIGMLVDGTPSAENVKTYAGIVRHRSEERTLLRATQEAQNVIFGTTEGKVEQVKSILFKAIDSERAGTGIVKVSDSMPEWIDRMDYRMNTTGDIEGLSTGFVDYDNRTCGLCPGDLIIVAGRPSMGKSTFVMNIADYVSMENVVQVHSMEMPRVQLIDRMISNRSNVPLNIIRNPKKVNSDEDWERIKKASCEISERNLFIDDRSGMTTTEILSSARKLKRNQGLGLIIIDYLQIMEFPSGQTESSQIGLITKALKNAARTLDVPIMLLSQLNRSLENRGDKRPIMSDLRQSGSIEQDADIVTFIYRDEIYNENSPDKGSAEIITRKVRNGEPGTDVMTFEGKFSRFKCLDTRYGTYTDSH